MSNGRMHEGKVCEFEGCDRKVVARGKKVVGDWCVGHYNQQQSGVKMKPIKKRTDYTVVTEKTCKTCGETKALSEFYKMRTTWQPECKICHTRRTSARNRELLQERHALAGTTPRRYTRRQRDV
jgi:hypothetical protein